MHLLSDQNLISETSIPVILQWWTQRKRRANARDVFSRPIVQDVDSTYLEKYQRLMDIYSVVKSGGTEAQIQAAKAHCGREHQAITQRLNQISNQPEATDEYLQLLHEAQELERSTHWRINQLQDIHPEEELAVREYLADIEQILI